MTQSNNRQDGRDSLFLLADLRKVGVEAEYRLKIRNLSAGGMMVEGPVAVMRGDEVEVNLRNLGWVRGVVAWIQDSRFGVAFIEEIDPKAARAPLPASPQSDVPRFVKTAGVFAQPAGPLRKI